jgi:signal transduction histidine kinase
VERARRTTLGPAPAEAPGPQPPAGQARADDVHDLAAVADLAARLWRVPLAVVTLAAADGSPEVTAFGGTGLPASVDHRLLAPRGPEDEVGHGLLVVGDTWLDPAWADHPLVGGRSGLRFVVRQPLLDPSGTPVGLLCLLDTAPRSPEDAPDPGSLTEIGSRLADLLVVLGRHRASRVTFDRLEGVHQDLRESNDRLVAFAGQVSHDLKAPLASISMSMDLIEDEAAGDHVDRRQVHWFVEKARQGARRMQALIDDLLDYATQGGPVEARSVDLDLVLAAVLDDLAQMTRNAEILTGRLPVVLGDEVQLRSLLQNLISNALKFARPGVHPLVRVEAHQVQDRVRVEVIDNGRGIAAGVDPERLFEPLVRGDHSVPGAGIGLATCRRVVEAHGGRIGLVRRREGGVLAWIELPVSAAGLPA